MSKYFQDAEVRAFTELADESFSLFIGKMYDFADEITDRGHEIAADCLRWMYLTDRWPKCLYSTEWACQFVNIEIFVNSYYANVHKHWFPNILVKHEDNFKGLHDEWKARRANGINMVVSDNFRYYGYTLNSKDSNYVGKFIFHARNPTLIEAVEQLMDFWINVKEKDRITLMKLAEVSKMVKNL